MKVGRRDGNRPRVRRHRLVIDSPAESGRRRAGALRRRVHAGVDQTWRAEGGVAERRRFPLSGAAQRVERRVAPGRGRHRSPRSSDSCGPRPRRGVGAVPERPPRCGLDPFWARALLDSMLARPAAVVPGASRSGRPPTPCRGAPSTPPASAPARLRQLGGRRGRRRQEALPEPDRGTAGGAVSGATALRPRLNLGPSGWGQGGGRHRHRGAPRLPPPWRPRYSGALG